MQAKDGPCSERCRDAGMDRFITKPIARAALFRAVEELRVDSSPTEVPPELAGHPAFLRHPSRL
jgi:CheY-like chemotaxis protein